MSIIKIKKQLFTIFNNSVFYTNAHVPTNTPTSDKSGTAGLRKIELYPMLNRRPTVRAHISGEMNDAIFTKHVAAWSCDVSHIIRAADLALER